MLKDLLLPHWRECQAECKVSFLTIFKIHTICAIWPKSMRNILLSEREGVGGRLQLVDNDIPISQTCVQLLEKPCPMMLVVFKILIDGDKSWHFL